MKDAAPVATGGGSRRRSHHAGNTTVEESVMYTEQQVRDMSSGEFADLLRRRMTNDDLVSLLHFVRGYNPRAVANALNYRGVRGQTCGKQYRAADDGKVRACERQPHDTGSHWTYDADNNAVHWSAPPAINGDRHPAAAVAREADAWQRQGAEYHGDVRGFGGEMEFCALLPGHENGCVAANGRAIVTASPFVRDAEEVAEP